MLVHKFENHQLPIFCETESCNGAVFADVKGKDKLALPIRDKKQSNISIYLRPEEFDFGFIKKCSKLVLDKKLVDNIKNEKILISPGEQISSDSY